MRAIIVGGNKTAYFLARQFTSKGYYVTIVHDEAGECRTLARQLNGVMVVHGDGSDPTILEEAGARQADVVLALTPQDQDNLIACQVAQQMYGVPRTVALINDPDNEEVFQRLGVSVTFSATRILSSLIEERTSFEDVLHLFPVAQGKIHITEVSIHETAPAVGVCVRDLHLPEGVLIAGILRKGAVVVPRGHTVIESGDQLILICRPADLGDALRGLSGDEA